MEANTDLTSRVLALQTKVLSWVPGDLMGLPEVKDAFAQVVGAPGVKALPKALVQALKRLGERVLDLVDEGSREPWLAEFRALDWPDAPLPDEGGSEAVPTSPEESDADAPQTGPGESGAGGSPYPEGYFAQVIADPHLLSQLCDEVREHLDAAQFSLVDLERDPSNAETVNRVFRAFHTLKSSAAFLGLKNIEEVAHVLEDLLVLVREGKLAMGSQLTDVIFQGIGQLRDLAQVIETCQFEVGAMVEVFEHIDIYPFIGAIHLILDGYQHRKLGEILLEAGLLTSEAVEQILEVQKATGAKFGEIAVEQHNVEARHVAAAIQKQSQPNRRTTYVKVLNDRLNALVDMVGELVVNQSMVRVHVSNPEANRDAAERAVAQLETVTTAIKNLVLSMGMVSVAEVFNKLRVVIRNTATETGKLVNPVFRGEDTELDRNIIETIYDPLVHLVRNAIDHGLESPDDRVAAGKPRMGSLEVAAEHKGGTIEITIQDDGAGISRERVVAKAVARGLVAEAQVSSLKEKEVYDLLFLPGFSTRDVATEISGRGVGLDVVRQNIDQVHGRVEIDSTLGRGTRFTIRIPLTLAIIDGFVTQVDDTKYVFPFNVIEEILVAQDCDLKSLDDGSHLVYSRGQHLPVLLAGTLFGHKDYAQRARVLDGKLILLIGYANSRYGVAVDAIVGKQEIVIKNLTEALAGVKVFSGGTIFGDGDIGFVVNVEEFIAAARKDEDENSHRG
jgi:two-component system chemotaxis sensor kinase CheA